MAGLTGIWTRSAERRPAVALGLAGLATAVGLLSVLAYVVVRPSASDAQVSARAAAHVPAAPDPRGLEAPSLPGRLRLVDPWTDVAVLAPALASSTPAARVATGPIIVDTSSFPPPPPRVGAPPPNSVGIARMVSASLAIDHYIEVVGIEHNQMQTPADANYAIGWYREYGRPGGGGNVIVSAHETWNHTQGPFFGLHRAKSGDEITIEMTDGRRYRYMVVSNVRYSIDTIPMAEIIWPSKRKAGEEWLTLITCGGRIVYDQRGFGDYLDRDVVIAKRVVG